MKIGKETDPQEIGELRGTELTVPERAHALHEGCLRLVEGKHEQEAQWRRRLLNESRVQEVGVLDLSPRRFSTVFRGITR